jgi:hypothetical protein
VFENNFLKAFIDFKGINSVEYGVFSAWWIMKEIGLRYIDAVMKCVLLWHVDVSQDILVSSVGEKIYPPGSETSCVSELLGHWTTHTFKSVIEDVRVSCSHMV